LVPPDRLTKKKRRQRGKYPAARSTAAREKENGGPFFLGWSPQYKLGRSLQESEEKLVESSFKRVVAAKKGPKRRWKRCCCV